VLVCLAMLGAVAAFGAAAQAHEPEPNDEPASRYAIETATDVSLSLDGFEGEATLDDEGAYLSVTVANDREDRIHNVTIAFTGMPAGVEVAETEAHASAATPNETVVMPHVEAGKTANFGLGVDLAGADPGGMDLEAVILFEGDDGTRHAATEEVSLTIEDTFGIPGPSMATLVALLAGAATASALSRQR
jgi:hypothetical protein